MREHLVNALAELLANNVGNRLTNELATGIATTFNQIMLQMPASEPDKSL